MLRHGPLRAPRSENALLMQWTHIATCAIFVKLRTQEYAKRTNIQKGYTQNAPAQPGRLREHTKTDYIYVTIRLVDRHHRDAALHRTGDFAQIATHAFFLDHLVGARAGGVDQLGDRLVRGVFAGHVALAAFDALVRTLFSMTFHKPIFLMQSCAFIFI